MKLYAATEAKDLPPEPIKDNDLFFHDHTDPDLVQTNARIQKKI